VEKETPSYIRASAQGLFMMLTNGVGAIIGSKASGYVIDRLTINGVREWSTIWLVFAGYALVLAIIFPLVFRYKHISDKELDGLSSRH
jgi:NHS family xanthosine MFS transporter